MRKLVKILVSLLLVLFVFAGAIPFLIPLDSYKQKIIEQVKEKTGRDLIVAGGIKVSLFPVLGIQLEQVSLSSPKGYSAPQMFQADEVVVKVSLVALLHKQLDIQSFVLMHPIIALEINAEGIPNWEFSIKDTSSQNIEGAAATSGQSSGDFLAGLLLGDVTISNGELSYSDVRKKKKYILSRVNLKAELSGLQKPFFAYGDALWNNKAVAVKFSLAEPLNFIEGKKSSFSMDLKAPFASLHYEGKGLQSNVSGAVDINVISIPKLTKWLDVPFAWKGVTELAFAVRGDLSASQTSVDLKNADITLDAIKFKGAMKASYDGKIPIIEAKLDADEVNLTPYFPQQQVSSGWLIDSAMAASGWNNDRIDFSALRSLNAIIDLNMGGVLLKKIKIGKSVINIQLNNGVFKLAIPEASLYSGKATTTIVLDANGALNQKITFNNVQVGPFLTDAIGQSRFDGAFNMSTNVTSALTSQRNFIDGLSGDGVIKMADGAIKGIDLAGMVRNVQSAYKDMNNTQQKTDFSELGGTFTIMHGILTNKDLAMKAPLVRLSGQGTVDLVQQLIHYRLVPMFVSTLQGQGGKEKRGLEVPIIIDGALSNPSFIPDFAGIAKTALENPEVIKETVKSVKEELKKNSGSLKDLKGILKGFSN